MYGTFQRDFTTPNVPRTTYNIQFGVPLPIFDRNRGNIMSAQGNVIRSTEEIRRVEYDLTAQLVDAFTRFETSRVLLQYNREQILPDLTLRLSWRLHSLPTGRGNGAWQGGGRRIRRHHRGPTEPDRRIGRVRDAAWESMDSRGRPGPVATSRILSELNLGTGELPPGHEPGERRTEVSMSSTQLIRCLILAGLLGTWLLCAVALAEAPGLAPAMNESVPPTQFSPPASARYQNSLPQNPQNVGQIGTTPVTGPPADPKPANWGDYAQPARPPIGPLVLEYSQVPPPTGIFQPDVTVPYSRHRWRTPTRFCFATRR